MNIAIGTRRLRATFAALLTLSLVATLVVAETASAATLSERLATRTATKLVKKQLADRERDLVEARISEGERFDRNEFRFLYDDLNREGEICTGIVQVRLLPARGDTVQARFLRGATCRAPGAQALAVRGAARSVARSYLRAQRAVARSVRRFTRSSEPCDRLRVPRDRRDEATLLLLTGLVQATVGPLDSTLQAYTDRLGALGLTDEQLVRGASAWREFLDSARALPTLSPNACAVLTEWAANGFTDETAPVDFAALDASMERMAANGGEVRRTARHLVRLGVDPLTASAFALDDLIGTVTSPRE